jgi:hypothetical protein
VGNLVLLHPWLLLGLLGASLPIIIHLIGKRRAPVVRFAAFDFLVAVNKRLARRERLRQLLLLLMRVAAVIALVLAASRPMPARPATVGDATRRLVMVIDASASMGYVHEGTTLLERAKKQARDLLTHLTPADAVSLVIAGTEVRAAFQNPTVDHQAVRAAIDAVGQPAGVADIGTAIDTGLAQLGATGGGAQLVILSDLAENSFEHLRPTALDPAPEVRLIDPAEREQQVALGNVGIESLRIVSGQDAATERRFELIVRNWGSAPVAKRALELVIGDDVVVRAYVDLPPRGVEEKVLTHNFEGPGVFDGQVRLVAEPADGFPTDDAMRFVTQIVPGIRVLAVNGDPRTTPYEDELFFLERALEAVPKGEPPIALRIVTLEELPDTELEGFNVVVLANVGELPPAELTRLRELLKAGGGLLFTLGDRVRFEEANELFGDLLPFPLRDLHRAADADAGTPPIGIGDLDWDHPVLAGLGQPLEQSLRPSRTARYFNLGVGAGLKTRPVLRFDNGAPALIERRGDDQRVMLLTTSVDVDFTDLPLRSGFPALLQRTVRYLARAVEIPGAEGVRTGGAVEIAVPTGVKGVALTSPSGARRVVTVEEGVPRVRFDQLTEIGQHKIELQRGNDWAAEPRLDVMVNPSLEESDFMPVSAERISEALGGETRKSAISVVVGTGEEGDPFAARGFATYLLVVLGLLFVGESLLASRG